NYKYLNVLKNIDISIFDKKQKYTTHLRVANLLFSTLRKQAWAMVGVLLLVLN
nr:hypothetical protein [Tanacetum cinerariifolium]